MVHSPLDFDATENKVCIIYNFFTKRIVLYCSYTGIWGQIVLYVCSILQEYWNDLHHRSVILESYYTIGCAHNFYRWFTGTHKRIW